MKQFRISFLVVALSLMLTGMAFAVDIPNISTWTQSMGVGGGGPGLGDLLLGPLYDVRAIKDPNLPPPLDTASYAQYTMINLVNTDSDYGVIARLRFREWKRSDEVLDIDIPLSCNDVWVGEVSLYPSTGGGILRSPDRWISGLPTGSGAGDTFPSSVIGTSDASGLAFRIFDIPTDSVTTTDAQKYARTLYGYFEVIAEEKVKCTMSAAGNWTRLATDKREVPDMLMGQAYIIRPDIAISHQYNLNAYSDFAVTTGGIWKSPETGRPNLFADVQAPPPPGIGGFDQLEAIMSKVFVTFQYVNGVDSESNTPRSTSVVVTFPTKHFHYASTFHAGGVAGWPPFSGYHETTEDGANGGEVIQATIYDRNETTFQPPSIPISPPAPGTPASVLPWEVNVIGILPLDPLPDPVARGFRDNVLMATKNSSTSQTFIEGWAYIDLSSDLGDSSDPRIAGGANRSQGRTDITFNFMGTYFPTGASPGVVGRHWPGANLPGAYRGLPAIGIVMTEFFNDSVNGYYGNTVPWQYGAAFGETPDVP